MSQASEEDSDPDTAQKDKDMHKFGSHCKYFKYSTNLPTKTLELPQTPETRMWILLQGGSVVQQSGYSVLTARNLVIMLRMQKAHNGLKDLRLMNKSWKLITTTWQRSMEVPNAVQETDSEPYESVQYDTDDNVVCQ
ncbi:hypothetical protein Tco_0454724 [Tanacetum coccineum]